MIKNIIILLILSLIIISGCSSNVPSNTRAVNPASVNCEEQGHTLEFREDEKGNQQGICVFSNGLECEEWEYFRGECNETN